MGKIIVEGTDAELLNKIVYAVVEHFNEKQDNFSLKTEGFEVDADDVDEVKSSE